VYEKVVILPERPCTGPLFMEELPSGSYLVSFSRVHFMHMGLQDAITKEQKVALLT
jgi:hypothetical protein